MFNKILVAVDESDASLHALEVATKLALDNEAERTILTAIPNTPLMAQTTHYHHTYQNANTTQDKLENIKM